MTTNFQKRSLKQWHKALLRLTLPIVWVFLFICAIFTFAFLVIPCAIAAFISWVIFRNAYPEYTTVWAIFPLFVLDLYIDWLIENDVIKSYER